MSDVALGDLILPDHVMFDLATPTKRTTLQALAARAAGLAGCDDAAVVDVILAREALGSTGFGAGTAIPHGRLAGLGRIVVVGAKLTRPIDFAALDTLPVDLIVLMLAPEGGSGDHLKVLARISRALRDAVFCAKLRGAGSAAAFYALFAGVPRSHAA